MAKVVYVSGDDWDGLYVDGKLVAQGHSLPVTTILRECGVDYEMRSADEGQLREDGDYPTDIKDAKFTGKPWK